MLQQTVRPHARERGRHAPASINDVAPLDLVLLGENLGSAAAIMPTKEEKEVVDAFASVFTVIDAGTFSVRRAS